MDTRYTGDIQRQREMKVGVQLVPLRNDLVLSDAGKWPVLLEGLLVDVAGI